MRKKPVYFWTHGLLNNEKGIKAYIRVLFYKLPSGLLLYGNHARNILIQKGFDPEKLHVIYNSLDYNNQIKLRDSLNEQELLKLRANIFYNPEYPQLIFIGRLTRQKKLHLIIETIEILQNQGLKVNLLFVGEGEEKQILEKLISDKGLDKNVYFYGASYDEAINYKLIASSDICISPGEVGLTAMHSLIYGTPVITHNNFNNQMPEFEAIEKDKTGDFFEEDNYEDIALKIKRWLRKHPDKEKVKKDCYSIIDLYYNPSYQKEKICNILRNEKNSKVKS